MYLLALSKKLKSLVPFKLFHDLRNLQLKVPHICLSISNSIFIFLNYNYYSFTFKIFSKLDDKSNYIKIHQKLLQLFTTTITINFIFYLILIFPIYCFLFWGNKYLIEKNIFKIAQSRSYLLFL